MEKIKTFAPTLSRIAVLLICTVLGITFIAFIGCDEAKMIEPIITDEPADATEPPTTVGEVKEPEEPTVTPTEPEEPVVVEEPVEPTPPADTTPPTVVEVEWFADEQRTQTLTTDSTVRPGDTVYAVVLFSEPVTLVLSYVIDTVAIDADSTQPVGENGDRFIVRLPVPTDAAGTITLHIGSATADLAGNTVAEASEHLAPFVVEEPVIEPTPPTQQDDPHLQKAIEVMTNIILRQQEVVSQALQEEKETGVYPWEWRNKEFDRIYLEETGIDYFDRVIFVGITLRDTYIDENPEDYERIRKGDFSVRGMVIEYLRLYFTYPQKRKGDLLALYRQSCKDGRVSLERDIIDVP